ncbi:MAG: acyl carrier protein [Campylobacteraceae bacterium]|nr:acyl carrier protein [Campylobacteraceae bacterium]
MIGSQNNELKLELKQLIIKECDKEDFEPESIDDNAPLFGSESTLELDSMDALQISMALKEKYGVEVTDSKKIRTIMSSINTLADYIQPK